MLDNIPRDINRSGGCVFSEGMSFASQTLPLVSCHTNKIRNVCILAHVDHGKCTALNLLLFLLTCFWMKCLVQISDFSISVNRL